MQQLHWNMDEQMHTPIVITFTNLMNMIKTADQNGLATNSIPKEAHSVKYSSRAEPVSCPIPGQLTSYQTLLCL